MSRFEDGFEGQCVEVYRDMASRYSERFLASVGPELQPDYADRFSSLSLGDLAETAAYTVKHAPSSRITEGYLVRLDEDRVQTTSRRLGGLVVVDLFINEVSSRAPWPELQEPYAGMSIEDFKFAVADEYARDIVDAVIQGITPDLSRHLQTAGERR